MAAEALRTICRRYVSNKKTFRNHSAFCV